MNDKQLFDKLIENRIEKKSLETSKPCFIKDHPLLMSPLAKSHAQGRNKDKRGAQYLAERFELFINGMEVINAYSEQNDAEMQSKAFIGQSELSETGTDEELVRSDQDFIDALKCGMPPTAGWGCGIDRLAMLMCGATSIREVILFPAYRTHHTKKNK